MTAAISHSLWSPLRYPAFRLPVSEVEAAVEAALDKAFAARVGKRTWVRFFSVPTMVLTRVDGVPPAEASAIAAAALRKLPGIWRALSSEEARGFLLHPGIPCNFHAIFDAHPHSRARPPIHHRQGRFGH